jgi:hypothetical protein
MSSAFIETLEHRTFLSASVGNAQPLLSAAPSPALTVAAKVTLKLYVKTYTGTASINGISGTVNLKVTSVSSGAVKATLSSTQWGGISLPLTGTVNSAGAVTLAGKNARTNIKQLKGTIASNNINLTGTVKAVQMGLSATGTFSIKRVSTPPAVPSVKWPNLLHSYKGKTNQGDTITVKFTTQVQGCVTGTASIGKCTGFILTNGKFYLIVTESDGYTIVQGTRNSKGVLSGTWTWYGDEINSGTFSFSQV